MTFYVRFYSKILLFEAYDREIPTYEAIPDIRDEIMEADERKKAISRNNVMDLVYHALTNQSASISMKSPSTGLHLSSANFTEREKYQQPRALDQFHVSFHGIRRLLIWIFQIVISDLQILNAGWNRLLNIKRS